MSPFYARAQKCWYLVRRLADADRPSDHMSRLRTFTAPLCSRAGAGDVVLAHLPPRLRSYLSEPAVAPLQKAALLLTTDKMREGAKGMEKGIGIGAAAIELLHQRNGGALMQGDPVRVVGGKHAGRHGYIIMAEPLTVANVHVRLEDERNYHGTCTTARAATLAGCRNGAMCSSRSSRATRRWRSLGTPAVPSGIIAPSQRAIARLPRRFVRDLTRAWTHWKRFGRLRTTITTGWVAVMSMADHHDS